MKENKFVAEDLMGKRLTAIQIKYCNYDDDETNVAMDIESISFGFNDKTIIISAIGATDELKIELSNVHITNQQDINNLLATYIGKKLGFVWQCTHLGLENYLDMCILSFEQLHPNILILCEGSVLLLFEAKPFNIASSPKP